MMYAPSFIDLHAAHLQPTLSGSPRGLCHPQTVVVSCYFHLELAPRHQVNGEGFRFHLTIDEISDRIGLLPSTVKTALKRCQDDGVLLVERSTVKDHLAISTLWPPTPKGGVS